MAARTIRKGSHAMERRVEHRGPTTKPKVVTLQEAEYLRNPKEALAQAAAGKRVEVRSKNGTATVVIYPGTIADLISKK